MPDHYLCHRLGLQPHSVFVPLVLLLRLFARYCHDGFAVAIHCQTDTVKTSPSSVTSGIGKTSIEIPLIEFSGTAMYTGFAAVDRLGDLGALQTADALQYGFSTAY